MHQQAITLINGRVLTMSEKTPTASALGILGERIACVGSDEQVLAQMPAESKRIDLDGKMVIPGLIDAHAHLLWMGGAMMRWADLTGATSIGEIQDRLRAHHEKMKKLGGSSADWLLGIRFDQEILAEQRWPNKHDLDEVSAELPIMIVRLCGHANVANSKALEIGGIESETGLLTENDPGPIWAKMPDPTEAEYIEISKLITEHGLKVGLTTVHCLLDAGDEVRALQKLHARGGLKQRLRLQIPIGYVESLQKVGLISDFGDSMLRLGSLKLFADGSMGARTAAMTEPYDDDPSTTGILMHTHDELVERAVSGHKAGFQLAIHAIGDAAIDQAIDAIEAALASDNSTGAQRRHRIEHASIIRPDQIERMAKLGIIGSIQPQFINTDFWTCDRVGKKRTPWVYPFKTMKNAGIKLAGGSDTPVEVLNPFQGIQRAILRDENTASERFTLEEAIYLYTMGGSYAGFEETEKGSLDPGKLADLLVLPCDLREIDPSTIEDVRPEMVFVGGRAVIGGE